MPLTSLYRLPAVLFFCFLFFWLPAQDKGWKLTKETDDMRVYYRSTSYSDINEVKIEAMLEASLSTVVAVLKDITAYEEWIYKCAEASRMEPSTNNSSVYYCRLDFPWPLSDRDFIASSKLRQDPKTRHVFIDVVAQPDYTEEKDGIVRIQTLNIHYELVPLDNGKVQMLYRLHSDPGGALPAWLVNMAIENGPMNTVRGMRRMLENDKYRKVQLAYIKD